jgi:phage protein D
MPTLIDQRRRAYCQILLNGKDVTSIFEPFLISVVIIDSSSLTSTASIELDDRDGKVPIPPPNAECLVRLGWASSPPAAITVGARSGIPTGQDGLGWEGGLQRVFWGAVNSVESGFARRGGGRRLWIDATSANMLGQGKEVMKKTWGEGDLQDHIQSPTQGTSVSGAAGSGGGSSQGVKLDQVLQDAAKAAGYKIEVHPKMKEVMRDFWQQDESFHALGRRLAQELGGQFFVKEDTAYFTAGDGTDVKGQPMGEVTAEWGFNLISWRIKPFTTRPDYKGTKSAWFNIAEGKWEEVTGQVETGLNVFGTGDANLFLPQPAPNRQVGEQLNGGSAADAQNERGTGWVTINGEPEAQAGKTLSIRGAREGVDGSYRIKEAEHHYTRQGGYTTRCVLERPGAGATANEPDTRGIGQPIRESVEGGRGGV